ncbi:MAG TPA: hypothetical protein VM287_10990 [Egibacteraceae bacterium]|nr:hypothetical protein [Egibacteraceae bacterium]
MDQGHYLDLLHRVFAGRKVVLAAPLLADPAPIADILRSIGVDRPLIIAAGRPAGEARTVEQGECVTIDVQAPDYDTGIRVTEQALGDPPRHVMEAVDRYDPDGHALAIGTMFTTGPTIARRPVYGVRRPEWAALEDKITVDPVWDAAGVPRPPSAVVPASREGLWAAHRRLDRGLGTAWAGDAKEGFNSCASYLRWIRRPDDAAEAVTFFEQHCDLVRVTPFLEGIPCSIHGMVLPEDVLAFRPVEMLTLRPPGNRLHYVALATYWDPPDDERDAMRDVARRVGAFLRERMGYRGAFTIDGVMSEEGFRPTELNARWGSGLNSVTAGLEFPLWLLDKAVVAGEPLDYRALDLEAMVVESADANRGGGAHAWSDQELSGLREEYSMADEGGRYRLLGEGEEAEVDGWLRPGSSILGDFLRFTPAPGRVEPGPPFAPRAVAALDLADRELGTSFGHLEAARPVR